MSTVASSIPTSPGLRKQLYIAYAIFVISGMFAGGLGVSWLYISDDFELKLSALGTLLTVGSATRLILSVYSGRIVAWMGMGTFMGVGIVFNVIGGLMLALAPNWEIMILSAVVQGFGGVAAVNGLNTYVSANYPASRMNYLHGFFGLGATLGPLLTTFMVEDFGLSWRHSYGVMTFFTAVIAFLVLTDLGNWHMAEVESDDSAQNKGAARTMDTLRLPMMGLLILLFLFSAMVEVSTGQLSGTLFADGRGISDKVAGAAVSAFWVSLSIGRVVSGFIVDRISHTTFLRMVLFGVVLGATLLWMNLGTVFSFLALGIMGLCIGPTAPTLVSDVPGRVGKRHAANAIGFLFAGANVGIAVGPWLGGVLAEHSTLEIVTPFIMTIALTLLLLHEVLILREQRNTKIRVAALVG